MASIESLGLGSGVLTTELVENIINAEREAADLRLDSKQQLVEAKITAYGEIQSQLSTLDSAVSKLASPSLANATVATSSNEDILTATTSSVAEPGSYTIEVLNTARAHSLASDRYTSFDEIVGTGKLVFTFGENSYDTDGNLTGQDVNPDKPGTTISIDNSNRTLSGIRDAINSADMGVTASIINDGSGYRLLMTSADTGKEQAMRIQALDSSGAELTTGLSALAFNASQGAYSSLEETSTGQDAQLRVNGLNITRSSNAVDEVVKGVTLNLQNADVGNTVTVTVAADVEQLSENLQAFVDAYNTFKQFSDELSTYDSANEQAGLLLGDSTIRSIQYQVRSLISQPIAGLSGSAFRSLTELGVNTDQDNDYLLYFDQTTFNEAITSDRRAVASILAKSGLTTDSQVTYVNDSINTQPGSYDVHVTQLATQAMYQGGRVAGLDFSTAVSIDDSNDNFTIRVNGTTAQVQLTHGNYDSGDALAKELALQINSAENIANSGFSVSVDHNASDPSFSITSNKYGASSQVYFTSVDNNTANTLGFNTLNAGTYKGVELTTLNASAFNGRGASTLAGNRPVADNNGIDFASSNATFSLALEGAAAVAITVSQSASGKDLNSDGVYGDRQDTLQAIQSAIDSSALSGQVTAAFDDSGYLTFTTSATGSSHLIEITAVGSNSSDTVLGLSAADGVQSNGKNPGVTFAEPVDFRVKVNDTLGDTLVSVPAGTYLNGEDLAAQVQASINSSVSADTNLSALVSGADTSTGSRDISSVIDFAAAASGFRLNVAGNEQEIIINSSSGDNLADIQTALDTAYGSGVVSASLGGSGLKLVTVVAGHEQYLEVMTDGRGAQTSAFADISSGIDFSASNASFTLTVDGTELQVNVTEDGTGGSNDSASNLAVIQQAVDEALVNSGTLAAGDVQAKVNDSGQLYFETASKNGIKTAATFGASASIQVSNLSGSAATTLGMSDETSNTGYDGMGLTAGERRFGFDLDTSVEYRYDADNELGSLHITIGGQGTAIGFTDLDSTAISFLGLQDVSLYAEAIPVGKDIAGTINGVEATGSGQFLKAVDGNTPAKPGYYIGSQAADFSSPVTLDDSNNRFSINVDGVEAEVALAQPATYISGSALASAVQTAINGTDAFKSADISVNVEYTGDATSFAYGKLGIVSSSSGKDSQVTMTSVSSAATAVFGFVKGKGDGEAGTDAQGNVDDASGLRLKITGGEIGARGTVTYVSGFADQLSDLLDSVLTGSNSVIKNKLASLDGDQEAIDLQREKLDARIAAQEARLKSQFLYNDSIIQTLNTTLDYIQQQFDALNNANSK